MEQPPLYLTVKEAADVLRMNRQSVYRLIAAGLLPAFKVGKASVRIKRDDLHAWIEKQATASA